MRSSALVLSAATGLVSAHFQLTYPTWRADTLADNTTFDQWSYPCAGVPYGTGNKTEWPLSGEGASVALDLHHPWSYVYINLGLGDNATNFNISLTPELLNVTGKGEFCLTNLPLPGDITDGQNATIQVVTGGQSGSALYNCADIVFRSSAQSPSSEVCTNSTGVTATVVGQTATDSSATPEPTPNSAPSGTFRLPSRATSWGVAIALILGVIM
ncbi:hypothetical protein F5B22DRAFT_649374 [Xylaria bambusicola]|uniref:uncharacterized protein n=1 Tax=Xylaria bambusicola TaxID=326684 RepID=UPI0020079889|nr:uncharacterized protein F5B22DRAFT_649374 [Xylaria bambusicola]KAI0509098.1 hypothetical protein F5B22DRAFT_649374 [Xylaria bambusicola]